MRQVFFADAQTGSTSWGLRARIRYSELVQLFVSKIAGMGKHYTQWGYMSLGEDKAVALRRMGLYGINAHNAAVQRGQDFGTRKRPTPK